MNEQTMSEANRELRGSEQQRGTTSMRTVSRASRELRDVVGVSILKHSTPDKRLAPDLSILEFTGVQQPIFQRLQRFA